MIFTGRNNVVRRNVFYEDTRHPALTKSGLSKGRMNGPHALRHLYASVLLDAGENIKALARFLGHSDPAFTLRQYTHFMPASETRSRQAVNAFYESTDGLETAQERSSEASSLIICMIDSGIRRTGRLARHLSFDSTLSFVLIWR